MGIRTLAQNSWDSRSPPRALGPRTEWPVTPGRRRVPSDPRASCPEQLVELVGPRTQARFARDSWSTRRPSDPGPSRLGQLVEPEGPYTQVRVAREIRSDQQALGVPRDSWSTSWDLGPGEESHGNAGRPRVHPDQARVAWHRSSTPRHLGHGPESPWMLVETVTPRAQA